MIGTSFERTKAPLPDLFPLAEAPTQRIEAATGRTSMRQLELFRVSVAAEAYDEGAEQGDAAGPFGAAA